LRREHNRSSRVGAAEYNAETLVEIDYPRLGRSAENSLPWIRVARPAPYFVAEQGLSWTPIGHNDAIPWLELCGLIGRRDVPAVERHLRRLHDCGVTCVRVMLEYCEDDTCYFERPAGRFQPSMIAVWDDLVGLCAAIGLRLLVTPFDTFFTWNNWANHPYNRANGGPCADRTELLSCRQTRELIKSRLAFATTRWGADGVVFAWDLWNEMHPVQGRNDPDCLEDFIEDVGPFLRGLEVRVHGRAHLQTVSVFGPELQWKPWLNEPVYRHPLLDFATIHLYEEGTIDFPQDTVVPAISTGRLIRDALAEISDMRPLFDSEHGPIHTFKDHGITLPEAFDDEYFRHMQWAHFASGAAGGGMRWPNRTPHALTPGMRQAQRALAAFLPLLDWRRFQRRNMNSAVAVEGDPVAVFACGDAEQALLWLLRTDAIGADGRIERASPPILLRVSVPDLRSGTYRITYWDTKNGRAVAKAEQDHDGVGPLTLDPPPIAADLAIAFRRYSV
jgi:hypothetical protein